MSLLRLLPFLVLINANHAKRPIDCVQPEKCECGDEDYNILPFDTKTHDKAWWGQQRVALEKDLWPRSGVFVKLLQARKITNCTWSMTCVQTGGGTKEPFRTTIVMGFFGKRMNYNASFPVDQIDWPEISFDKKKQWTYRGYPIEFAGCLNENR